MIFPYKKYGPDILRPVISIALEHDDRRSRVEALVDSGSDMCIFHANIAEDLGINVVSGKRFEVTGLTGVKQYYYVHEVIMVVGDLTYKTSVGFMPAIAKFGYGILGQYGFFSAFQVSFDFQKAIVELNLREVKQGSLA